MTSYATRTSPVIRGKWILENILGTPPPPPPPNVPALKDNTVSAALSIRERLAEHRANAACASCHKLMDPVGFALENFDAVGRWRNVEEGRPIDATGGLPDGSEFEGVTGLEQALLDRPEMFVGTLTEKLLTFALGRGVEHIRRAGDPQDRPRRPRERLPLLVADRGNRDQHAVSDEEIRMIITKKAMPRRTFLRGPGDRAGAAAAGCDGSLHDRPGRDAGRPARLRRLGFVYMPMGCDVTRWTPPGADTLDELSPTLSPLAPVKEHVTAITNLELQNAYPGTHATSNAAFLSAARAKLDREHRLLPRHDRRSDRRQADGPGDAIAVAGNVDGSALDGRPVRQRLRLRLSEQSLVVFADDAAAGRGPSADRLRAPLRRRGQPPRIVAPR